MDERILELCSTPNGLSQESLMRKLEPEQEESIVSCLNELLEHGLLEVVKRDNTLYYKKSLDSTSSVDLNEDEKVIFNCVKSTGNQGVWTKDIKIRTNLHQAIISKVLKSLEGKKLIKAVKSAKNSTRRLYMLYELEPSQEIAGGPWFTDFELDCEFVEELVGSTHRLLLPRIFPEDKESIFPLNHPYPTAESLGQLISDSRICNTNLSPEHVSQIVDRLSYDGLIHIPEVESCGSMFSVGEKTNLFGIELGSACYY